MYPGRRPNPFLALLNKNANKPNPIDLTANRLGRQKFRPTSVSTPPIEQAIPPETPQNSNNEKQLPSVTEDVSENDPIIVFDNKPHNTSDDDDEPIGLGVRQPSFVSLHGQIIQKGGETLNKLPDLIEEIPEDDEPITSVSNDTKLDEKIDEDDDPQVSIVKHLQAKNTSKWAEIGYEPPKDLITMVRTRSQQDLQDQCGMGHRETSLSKFYSIAKTGDPTIGTLKSVMEDDEDGDPAPLLSDPFKLPEKIIPTPNRRKRSGSFGMKLGEASESQTRIHTILPDDHCTSASQQSEQTSILELPNISKTDEAKPDEKVEEIEQQVSLINKHSDNDEEYAEEEEEEIGDEEDNEEKLFGRLNDIVKDSRDSETYQFLLTGEKPYKNISSLNAAISNYIKIARAKKMTEEVKFLKERLKTIKPEKKSKKQKVTKSAIKNSEKHTSSKKSHNSSKDKADLLEVESPARPRISTKPRTKKQINSEMRLRRALARADADYEVECAEIERRFSSAETIEEFSAPSPTLLELRARVRRLRRANKEGEANRVQKQADDLADEEDLKNKERLEAALKSALEELEERRKLRKEIAEAKFAFSCHSTPSGSLPVRPPRLLERANDIGILHGMTEEVLAGKSPRDVSIDRIYRVACAHRNL